MLLCAACAIKPIADPGQIMGGVRMLDEVKQILRHGDWLVIRGVSGPDNLIATATNTPLSHAAIYDAENDQVIEADSTGVHTTPLSKFLGKAQRLLIIRPMWWREYSFVAVERARSWIGKPYNYTGLLGLNLPDRYYCTQLALRVYGPPHKPDNPIPLIIEPGQMYHWGTIVYDSGPSPAAVHDVGGDQP